jgi:DNA-binding response OmpR family regulator
MVRPITAVVQNWFVRLLVIEDDDAIADPLVRSLRAEHFDVEWVRTASGALGARPADLVLLDLGLPDRDGAEVLKELRRRSPVPVIVVTARGQESERVTGLNLGADDYVVKPFGFSELVARIWAVARRAGVRTTPDLHVQRVGGLEIDHRSRVVRVDGQVVACTPKEYALLEVLANDPGALVSRQELVDKVWGSDWYGTTKMIDVHMAALRKKIGHPGLIETIRGVGYRLGIDDRA